MKLSTTVHSSYRCPEHRSCRDILSGSMLSVWLIYCFRCLDKDHVGFAQHFPIYQIQCNVVVIYFVTYLFICSLLHVVASN
jgi:hypothetical protein